MGKRKAFWNWKIGENRYRYEEVCRQWYGEVNGVSIVEWILPVFSLNYYARSYVESGEDEVGYLRLENSGERLK